MKKKFKRLIAIGSIAILTVSLIVVINSSISNGAEYDVTKEEADKAYDLLKQSLIKGEQEKTKYGGTAQFLTTYYDFMLDKRVKYNLNNHIGELSSQGVADNQNYDDYIHQTTSLQYIPSVGKVTYGDSLQYTMDIPAGQEGLYYISLDYLVEEDILSNPTLSVKINNETKYLEQDTIDLPLIWNGTEDYDNSNVQDPKKFQVDSFGDETVPANIRLKTWQTRQLYDNQYITSHPLLFYFKEGLNDVEITCVSSNSPILFGKVEAVSPKKIPTYEEYLNNKQAFNEVDKLIGQNAIYYQTKNSSYLNLAYVNSPSVKPFITNTKTLNVISENNWIKAGQEISYTISTESAGLYKLGFHYSSGKQEFNVFRSIYINGSIPFEELESYQFKSTSTGTWANETLRGSDGKSLLIYLEKGDNIITIKGEKNPVSNIISTLQLVADHINYFALEILKITTSDIDTNKNYQLTKTIPETTSYLKSYDTLVKYLVMQGKQFSSKGTASSTLSYLQKAITTLKKISKKPDQLPLYLENLYSGSSSINQMLGDSINNIGTQPLSLDYLYAYGGNHSLPKANASGFKKFGVTMSQLFNSFFDSKYSQKVDKDSLTVWVNRPLTYINILQKMVDRDFNSNPNYSGPKIRISVMPDSNKLILANAAGENPDVALGLGSHMPFDLAIRNVALDLTQFDESGVGSENYQGSFYQVASRFSPGTLVPFNLGDGFYALPETLDFNVLMYRKDILSSFNISVPDNWNEVVGILPILKRYGMNFYMPISASNATKWFYQTSNLIYQNGGSLYASDGLSTTINSSAGVKGLTLLTELFLNYALDPSIPSFYNAFRYGNVPIGTAGFTDYLQMLNAAPELIGKWDVALPVGTVQADGSVDRTYISNGSSAMIFKNTEKPQESWDFLSWWTNASTQTEFSNLLQSTYGPEYVWLSSNLDAVADSSLDSKLKRVLLGDEKNGTDGSLNHITDIPRTPGQYMLERGLSNIWTTAVFENTPVIVAIDKEVLLINREITRKMVEFKYISSSGDVLKPYYVHEKNWVAALIATKNSGK